MSEPELTVAIVANSLVSPATMSGGDKILLELAKRWKEAGQTALDLHLCLDAAILFQRNVPNLSCRLLSTASLQRFGVVTGYMIRLFQSLSILKNTRAPSIVFSSSDFLMDFFPSWLLNRRFRGSRLACAVYLLAPSPFTVKYARSVRGFAYFFSQRIALGFMKLCADRVYVLNENDKEFLVRMGLRAKVKVIRGGVDLEAIRETKPSPSGNYDACFIGRIHEQKGVDDLIEIWKLVCNARRQSKLAIIGWGEERRVAHLKTRISDQGLSDNIDFLGFLDSAEKIATLKASKILVFPSLRESWGLVVCEAIAAEVPVVSYDLNVLKANFPAGLTTVPLGDKIGFSRAIIELLEDANRYESLRLQCSRIAKTFSWDEVAQETLADFRVLTNNESSRGE
jgi:glycosyltransferase involved in cell wall biosynthesis